MSGPSGSGEDAADRNVEVWKIKRLIKSLEMARGYSAFSPSLQFPVGVFHCREVVVKIRPGCRENC